MSCKMDTKHVRMKFGSATVDDLAAAIYSSFHGECNCTKHPWNANGTPWRRFAVTSDDVVVEAFRKAAMAARKQLIFNGVGTEEDY